MNIQRSDEGQYRCQTPTANSTNATMKSSPITLLLYCSEYS